MKETQEGLRLSDTDPYDRPRAQRAIVPAVLSEIKTSLKAESLREGTAMVIEAQDRYGKQAVRLMFDADGMLRVKTGGAPRERLEYPADTWIDVTMTLDCVKGSAQVTLAWDGQTAQRDFNFNQPLEQVERILFTTKAVLPWQTFEDCGKGGMIQDLPDDTPKVEAAYTIRNVSRAKRWRQNNPKGKRGILIFVLRMKARLVYNTPKRMLQDTMQYCLNFIISEDLLC